MEIALQNGFYDEEMPFLGTIIYYMQSTICIYKRKSIR